MVFLYFGSTEVRLFPFVQNTLSRTERSTSGRKEKQVENKKWLLIAWDWLYVKKENECMLFFNICVVRVMSSLCIRTWASTKGHILLLFVLLRVKSKYLYSWNVLGFYTCTYTSSSREILLYLYVSTEKRTWYFYLQYKTKSLHVFVVSFYFIETLTVIHTVVMIIISFNFSWCYSLGKCSFS